MAPRGRGCRGRRGVGERLPRLSRRQELLAPDGACLRLRLVGVLSVALERGHPARGRANRRIERLEADLAKHKLALDMAGKAYARLEMLAEGAAPEQKPKP